MPPEHEITALHERIVTLEHWRIQLDIANARADEQRKHLDQRFDALDGKVTKINDSLTWIVRLVLGAIVLAIVTFALRGGFYIPS
jgi:cytochrome c-type biogenesis protein CcmH/NrfG